MFSLILFNLFLLFLVTYLFFKFLNLKKNLEIIKRERQSLEEILNNLELPILIVKKEEVQWQNKISLAYFGDLRGKSEKIFLSRIKNQSWEMKTLFVKNEVKVYLLIDKSQEEVFKRGYKIAISYLSHEIKTPFTVLKGYAEKLEEELIKLKVYHFLKSYFIPFKSALEKIDHLTSKLFSSLEYLIKELPLKPEVFDLKTALDEVVFWVKPLCEDKNLILELEIPDNIFIKGDKEWLMQAFLNPLENAIKYTPSGNKIILKVYERGKNTLNILIRDTGPGVSPEDLPFLGMPFFKSSAEKGLGFGLFITKKIIEAHQGRISFSLPPQGGLEVLIELPYQKS